MAGRKYKLLKRVPSGRLLYRRVAIVSDRGIERWPDLEPLVASADRLIGLYLNADLGDISAIARLTALRELHITNYSSGGFDLSGLPKLDHLWLHVGPDRPIVPGGGEVLRSLVLLRCSTPWSDWIGGLPRLASLELYQARSYPRRFPESLERLEISGIRGWDHARIFAGPAGLKELCLSDVRGMVDLSAFSFARRLQRLVLEDCVELDSIGEVGLAPGCIVRRIGRTPGR